MRIVIYYTYFAFRFHLILKQGFSYLTPLIRSRNSAPSVSLRSLRPTQELLSTLAMTGLYRKPLCFILRLIHLLSLAFLGASSAHPAYDDTPDFGIAEVSGVAQRGYEGELVPQRREEYQGGRIIDISHYYREDMPGWEMPEGLGKFLFLSKSIINGDTVFFSELKLPVHSGTHVDSPGHVFQRYFEAGFDVDSLDLQVLNGPALLVEVPSDKNITADVMESLNIPRGVRRVIFKTLNTDRKLMWKKEFDYSYTGFMKDGAQWLVDNTDIKLVGIDYLSVAAFDDLIPSHLVLLQKREVIIVEGLNLENVKAGIYTVHCLPLRLRGSEGSPIRCILIK